MDLGANMADGKNSTQDSLRAIDERLIALLAERAKLLSDCAADEVSLAEQDLAAAEGLLNGLSSGGPGLPSDDEVKSAVEHWLRHSQSLSQRLVGRERTIAYLGPKYSFSYLATVKEFGLATRLVPVATIAAAFEEVTRGHADHAVVPIENSTDGRVVDTLGMFARSPAKICGEVLLPIHHCLLGQSDRTGITEVQSKPQALSQCREWLASHLPQASLVEVASTTMAAKTASERKDVAAIASEEAGLHYGLKTIERNIEDQQNNVTRFAIIGDSENEPTGQDKTALMFQLEHASGALANAMNIFGQTSVNLTWIESFPLPNVSNEYLFFVELEGHAREESVATAVERLREASRELDVLGSYPKAMR